MTKQIVIEVKVSTLHIQMNNGASLVIKGQTFKTSQELLETIVFNFMEDNK